MDIIINNLSKRYGKNQVLHHLCAKIEEGRITSIMGPSGVGKTTLLRILARLESADEGEVEGIGQKRVSMVFQEDRLCENLSPISNIRLVCGRGISVSKMEEELCKVGLRESRMQPVRELSGGMRRRVALVRALMASYDILILDEPFKGLDEDNKREMMEYTLEKSAGKTVIFVTHEDNEAKFMGGNIIHMGA
ncbi:ATP-binding cassette domain-containing protein [Kineothrix sp. MB12-C1]|uniref:ATP-binding cassette domain-containing protein n=1 Tax=Kineothrix sp. MB12-C1 TaxID=3070215 RepID=UPI0027D285D7|nr:ATP-binding cassette domain-containing protein [Kineothrix sp. MB12-C1]WMC91065.1 ATP-binding cassette domain-containing protein [Kineothrix sp. MB12-C1]